MSSLSIDYSPDLQRSPSSDSSYGRALRESGSTPSNDVRSANSRRSSHALSFDVWEKLPEEILLPRSEWEAKVMQKNPEILEYRERLREVLHLPSYGRSYLHGKTEVKETLSNEAVTQLIYQFLKEEQLTETLKVLEEETGIKYAETDLDDNALSILLKIAIKTPENIFNEPDIDETSEVAGEDPEVLANEDYVVEEPQITNEEDVVEEYIWDESLDNTESVVVYDNIIEAGNLNRLILWVFNQQNQDKEYKKYFLMSYSSFVSSETLLKKLIQLYTSPKDSSLAMPAVSFIRYWLETEPHDFAESEKLMSILVSFVDEHLVKDKQFTLVKLLRNVIAKLEHYNGETFLYNTAPRYEKTVEPKVPRNIFSPTLTLDDVDEEEIARQLSLVDFKLFSKIKSSEFFSKAWLKTQNKPLYVNLLLNRFTEIAKWVASEILFATKPRHAVASRFLKIAEYLFKLNNFQALMAIYVGMTNSAVNKILPYIKREISRPSQEILRELHLLLSSDSSYQNYRASLGAATGSCVPIIGILLRDITFFEEAYPNKIKGLINFGKRRYQCETIAENLRFQAAPYPFQYVHQIGVLLKNLKSVPDKELYEKAAFVETSYINA